MVHKINHSADGHEYDDVIEIGCCFCCWVCSYLTPNPTIFMGPLYVAGRIECRPSRSLSNGLEYQPLFHQELPNARLWR